MVREQGTVAYSGYAEHERGKGIPPSIRAERKPINDDASMATNFYWVKYIPIRHG
jgi:hypothetical protein